jgi:TolB-like protein
MFIRKLFIFLFLISAMAANQSCVSSSVSFNKELLDKSNITIAVLPFNDFNKKEGNNSGALARNVFETRLVNSGFKVKSIEAVASELGYYLYEGEDYSKDWIIEAGKTCKADYFIFGSVHDYRVFQYPTSFLYIFSWLETTYSVGITARMVSAKTGEPVWTGSLTKKSYTFTDAAEEVVNDFIKSMKLKPAAQEKL